MKTINGAPLPKRDPTSDLKVVQYPAGLQIIEEMLYEESLTEKQQQKLLSLTKELDQSIQNIVSKHITILMEDRQIFEASREEIIRILTLGITGFDTPASDQSIVETNRAIKGLKAILNPYLTQYKASNPALCKTIMDNLNGALTFTKNTSFDSFDRLTFIEKYLNPLYKKIYELHLATGFETMDLVLNYRQAVNYHEKNLFSRNFLDKEYFYSHPFKKKEKVEALGRTLFFDPILSRNIQRTCGSCHQPEKYFTDGEKKSVGMNFKGTVKRNSPTLLNAVYAKKYFHDARSSTLENQAEHVIFSAVEFDMTFIEILKRLEQSDTYKTMFSEAFFEMGEKAISKNAVTTALAAYVSSLNGYNSAFDQYMREEKGAELSESAKNGFNIFMGKAGCGTCHFAPVFNGTVPPKYDDTETEVLGVTANTDFQKPILDSDSGRFVSGVIKDEYEFYIHSFKTPTVRNIEKTGPYMHNGAFESLEKVVEFYDMGGGKGMGLPLHFQTLPEDSLNLTKQEEENLIAFMKSLTDDISEISKKPENLPSFKNNEEWNKRTVGGEY
jgi:cytochrome c peroxidase